VKSLLEDLPNLEPAPVPDTGALVEALRGEGVRVVSFADWRRIDAAEVEAGKPAGKPREKFVRVADMLALLE
jgi:NADPH-dependent glutamate synthase beta subunit-like oxidoreductase